jgi:hypothetical protein
MARTCRNTDVAQCWAAFVPSRQARESRIRCAQQSWRWTCP